MENFQPHGSIIEVGNILIGHHQDYDAITGCTVIRFPEPAISGIDVRGSAAGTRSVDCLQPLHIVPAIHALVFTGGSAFGLASVDGVVQWLESKNIGFPIDRGVLPIVPGAVLFDLRIGDFNRRPDREMGRQAAETADCTPEWGSVGAGTGLTVGKLLGFPRATKSGIGTACVSLGDTIKVGAIAAVNAFGNVVDPASNRVIAGVRRLESGGFVDVAEWLAMADCDKPKMSFFANTTLVLIATNAKFNKLEVTKLAQVAHDGLALCIRPVHTTLDGDIVVASSCGKESADLNRCCQAAVRAVTLAVLHAVTAAHSLGGIPAIGDL